MTRELLKNGLILLHFPQGEKIPNQVGWWAAETTKEAALRTGKPGYRAVYGYNWMTNRTTYPDDIWLVIRPEDLPEILGHPAANLLGEVGL